MKNIVCNKRADREEKNIEKKKVLNLKTCSGGMTHGKKSTKITVV